MVGVGVSVAVGVGVNVRVTVGVGVGVLVAGSHDAKLCVHPAPLFQRAARSALDNTRFHMPTSSMRPSQ